MTAPESTTSARIIQGAERAERAVAPRTAGASYHQIGKQLGVSAQAAHKMVTKHLAEVAKRTADSAEQYRQMELARLDAAQAAIWPDCMKGDIQAIATLIKIMTRRAALLGLDAPTKQEVQQTLTHVEAYEYSSAVAAIAPGPVADSEPSGDDQGDLYGPALGQNTDGG